MLVIGESIHVISARVRAALEGRDKKTLQELAVRQVEAGAQALDLNIGPQKKEGPEVMSWLVDLVQEVADVRLCLDTTNAAALEAGLAKCKQKPIINSTDATDARMAAMMPLAKKYNSSLIALALGESGLPATAEERVDLVLTRIIPGAQKYGMPLADLYLDPLVLTVNGMQDQAQQTVAAVRYFQQVSDPPPLTTCGASNVSNGIPREIRPIINRAFVAMMMGVGISSAIINPLDEELMWIVKTIDKKDCSTKKGELYVKLAETVAAGEEFQVAPELLNAPEVKDIARTINILYNRQIFAPSYLTL